MTGPLFPMFVGCVGGSCLYVFRGKRWTQADGCVRPFEDPLWDVHDGYCFGVLYQDKGGNTIDGLLGARAAGRRLCFAMYGGGA